jgi:NOL1/NOP2/sun family putative RNA methylase
MDLPNAFIKRIEQQLQSEAADFFMALENPPAISIRLNPAKAVLKTGQPIPWCAEGMYLESRPSFTLDPFFHAGCFYVQEASSMFIGQVIKKLNLDKQTILALDACAAPGGKTTHLAFLLNEHSLIVSNETIASRVAVLKENIIKWGTGNVVVTNNDTSSFTKIPGFFDLILIDAPCSGEGLFRKDAEAIKEWSEENCSLCAGRQHRILANLLPALKQDGILIYCTCTYNPEENEKNVEWLLQNYNMQCLSIPIESEWGIKEVKANGIIAYSFFPHHTKGEGFFISVLQNKNVEEAASRIKSHGNYSILPKQYSFVKEWIEGPYELYKKEDAIYLLPSQWLTVIEFLESKLRVQYAGTLIGSIKHSNIIPAHELSMSIHLNKNGFPQVNLSKEDAIKYLRKDDFKIPASEKGWMLVTYENVPLGWINNIGNRFNNYYPTDWRIRMKA